MGSEENGFNLLVVGKMLVDGKAPGIFAEVVIEVSCIFGTFDVTGLAGVVGLTFKVRETAFVRS